MENKLMELWSRMNRAARDLAYRHSWRSADALRRRWHTWQDRQLAAELRLRTYLDAAIVE